jgi:hypothetical protein
MIVGVFNKWWPAFLMLGTSLVVLGLYYLETREIIFAFTRDEGCQSYIESSTPGIILIAIGALMICVSGFYLVKK